MKRRLFILLITIILPVVSCSFRLDEPIELEAFDWGQKKIKVHFTRPGYDYASGEDTGLNVKLASFIASARNTVDICIYELSEPLIYNAVINAHRKGIKVRFVGDINNAHYEGYQAFMREGIPMAVGNREKIMHNKYIIVDDRYLTTGSANFTSTGMRYNNENVLFIDSPELCAYYKKDFETMFVKGLFGLDKIGNKFEGYEDNEFFITNWDGTVSKVRAYFTPYDEESSLSRVDLIYMEYIDQVQSSIRFAIFAFTHPDIADRMIDAAAGRGVTVKGVFDRHWHSGNQYALHHRFINALTDVPNIHIKYDGNWNHVIGNDLHGSKIHNKLMMADVDTDNPFVMTGSFNFSKAASYKGNDENFLVIYDKSIAKAYSNNFAYMYGTGYHPTRDLGGDNAEWQDVWINEINWAGSINNIGVPDYSDKFVELRNNTDNTIDISGWQLVGTTAVSKYYRILMYIYPKGTKIEPNGYHVLFFSTNSAFNYENSNIDEWLYLHHPYDQNYVFLMLKDKDNRVIDRAGSSTQTPFAGEQSVAGNFASMYRVGEDGILPSSWNTTSMFNANVRSAYRLSTLATPGSD